mmetsp:Transcript_43635/g.42162  ORF Transcript_43635/g.42162 Transcript_43635/m.42162 type:complete len:100 (+) Transcript_43635:1513-1812(+)
MQSSNIYSVAETILLKWMQYHYNKMNPQHNKVLTNFDADLQDGMVFSALIRSHYGNARNIKELKEGTHYDDWILNNARRVIEAISEIGLQTYLTPQDIA